jgi:hypothetical protein
MLLPVRRFLFLRNVSYYKSHTSLTSQKTPFFIVNIVTEIYNFNAEQLYALGRNVIMNAVYLQIASIFNYRSFTKDLQR